MIFISIDDSEVKNLKNICDEVFGAANFVAQLIWQNKKGGGNDSTHIAIEHEYILTYAKNIALLGEFYESYSDDYIKRYKEEDNIGRFFWDTFKRKAGKQYYPITCPDGTVLEYDEDGNAISWLRSKARFDSDIAAGEIRIIKIGEKWSVQFKQRIPLGKTPRSIFTTETVIDDRGTTSTGASDVYDYFKKDVFSNPKPVELIRFLLGFGLGENDIVLDFFSGSGTTAEAVMRSNLEGGKNKFILVQLPENIDPLVNSSSANANLSMVYAYYEIGRMIVEEEQHGENRATYGKKLLKELSTYLTGMFGKGYSAENLKLMRRFYSIYSHDQIGETVFTQFENLPAISTGRKFYLSWSHYLKLMRIDNIDERHFYEIECVKNDWSLSELKRQYNSALYERLALSTDKDKVYRLALEGQKVETPKDAVKDPYVLEFLGLKELPEYSESELESRIIDHLQQFLLELGTGFAFIGRQVRFTFDEEHFMVDLVFYNRLLRCFVLFDLKIGELKHQDIGQMQMYVNYYDRKVKLPDENKTIGIVLCRDKNNAVVEMTLPEDNSQIFASKYETVLPKKEDLKKLLEEQIAVENGGAEE